MKVDKEQKRLKAIKLKYVLFPTKCDCCGEEVKKDFVKFHINWNMTDARSGKSNENPVDTHSLEYCVKCFDTLLEQLGLEKNENN